MPRGFTRLVLVLAVLSSALGCERDAAPGVDRIVELDSPAPPGSAEPNLTVGPDGRVYLSWLEPVEGNGHALRFSVYDGASWSSPRTVAGGPAQLANWADFPSLAVLSGGRIAAHYLERDSAPSHGYGIRVVRSDDEGRSWGAPAKPHRDDAQAEHGFVSLLPAAGDSVAAVWLDGRAADSEYGGTGETALRASVQGPDGGWSEDVAVDTRACDCCQTSAARTSRGVIVAYRDRSEGEIRDISIVRLEASAWSAPKPVSEDGWRMEACPVNGPAVTAEGERVAVAWFTAARDTAKVLVAFSANAGDSFERPVRVDAGDPEGRVDVELLADGSALVSWIERVGGRDARVLIRTISPDGPMSDTATVAAAGDRNATGFPRMARAGDRVFFAWTEPGERSRVRVASTRFAGSP